MEDRTCKVVCKMSQRSIVNLAGENANLPFATDVDSLVQPA